MSSFRQVRSSFFAISTLCLIVALAACSKKDVVQDEPAFGASGDGVTAPSNESVGTEGAGDAGTPSGDLRTAFFAYDSYALRGDAVQHAGDTLQRFIGGSGARFDVGESRRHGVLEATVVSAFRERRNLLADQRKRLFSFSAAGGFFELG